jgi:predicted nucleotidyltransferase
LAPGPGGNYKPDSDWDFLILFNKPLNNDLKEKIREKFCYAELETDQVIGIHEIQKIVTIH